MKGIILAGGEGSRMRPLTLVANKHLLPIYNKLMIQYPIETLKAFGGVDDILIVTGGEHVGKFAELLGDGSDYGVNITYKVQKGAGGIAQALGLAESFAGKEDILVILGDNIFDNTLMYGWEFDMDNAFVFLKAVKDPERFGVAEIKDGNINKIVEKPKGKIPSSLAVTGLYHYPNDVFDVVKKLKPSERGELEITDVNNYYIENGRMKHNVFEGFWSDAGTFESLLTCANWVKGYE